MNTTGKKIEEEHVEAASMDVETARAVLRRADEQRVRACAAEVQAVLKKHDCRISAHFIVTPPNVIEPIIDFIAIKR